MKKQNEIVDVDTEVTDDIKTAHYFYEMIESLFEENNPALIGTIESDDKKVDFIFHLSKETFNRTKVLQSEKEISFVEASDIAVEELKIRHFE